MALQLVLFLALQVLYVSAKCSDGTQPFKNSCYYFSHDAEEWSSAEFICSEFLNGHLVEVNDEAENNFLLATANTAHYPYWLGANDIQVINLWRWTASKTNVTYSNWGPGEPNNMLQKENCVSFATKGLWNDLPCRLPINFICEIPQI